jgi:type IV pilus assembly protein PilP
VKLSRVALIAALAACSDPMPVTEVTPPPRSEVPVKKAAAAPAANAAPTDEAAPTGYSPVGKRDPFRSYLLDMRQAVAEAETRKRQATESFELDQYRLTGLVTGTSQPVAMVEDPEGTGHALHIGARIGKNGGRVTRITDTGIIIVEEYEDTAGRRVRVPITINLPKPEIDGNSP